MVVTGYSGGRSMLIAAVPGQQCETGYGVMLKVPALTYGYGRAFAQYR